MLSAAALAEYLGTGHTAAHGAATGPMKEVIVYSTSQLTPRRTVGTR